MYIIILIDSKTILTVVHSFWDQNVFYPKVKDYCPAVHTVIINAQG